jgi:disease resistance protein RPS2
MGTAMKGNTIVELWKHALNELQRSVPCTGGVEDKLYKPLKWSYDSLEGKNIKPCFLYCSLFPEDFSIEISELVQCWLAEGLIDEQENYEDSVNRGIALIENLKDSCLLEDGVRKDTVKMHDVVRDVAIWIASSSEDECKSLVRSGIGLSEILS